MVHAFNPRQRQVHLYEFEAILAHEECQGSQGYTERPCLSSIKNITNFWLSIMTDVDSRLPTPHLVIKCPSGIDSQLRISLIYTTPPGRGLQPRSTLWLGRSAGVSWCRGGGSRGFGRGVGHWTLRAGLPERAGGDVRRGRRGTHSRAGHLQDPVPQPGDAGVDPRPPSFRTADPPTHDASKEESSRRLLADQRSPRVTLENRGALSAWMSWGDHEG